MIIVEQQMESEEEEENENGDDENADKYMVGVVEVNVVGLQYYDGRVTDGEMVRLIREPHNPYDKNAIQVVNIFGRQIGHIERTKACHLAPLVDTKLAVMEGIVPQGSSRNRFKMPCRVYIFSNPEDGNNVKQHLRIAGVILLPPSMRMEEEDASVSMSQQQQQAAAAARKQATKPKAMKESLDDVFAALGEMSGMQRQMMEPSPVISSTMFRHQKEALAWLIHMENSSKLPPFWIIHKPRGGRGGGGGGSSSKDMLLYKNTITNFSTDQRPDPLRGGLLADDMGLGKTLALLALVATNKPGAILPLPQIANVAAGDQEEEEEATSAAAADTAAVRPSKKRKLGGGGAATKKLPAAALEQPTDSPPQLKGPRATLIVCPLSVLSNWVTQLEEHTVPGSLGVHLYHGPDRIKETSILSSFDIVLTTYNILATEGISSSDNTEAAAASCCSTSPLQKVQWLRVILDEAHLIKSPTALQTKAAVALKAHRRWAVTGTPIQNTARDLFTLMQFLRLEPLNESSFWRRTVERPLMSGDSSGLARLQALMKAIALRRTKELQVNGHRLVELPRKTVTIHYVDLAAEDREVYDKLEENGKEVIGQLVQSGTVLQNYASVLQIILRLRQICDHSALCPAYSEMLCGGELQCLKDVNCAPPELLQKLLSVLQSGEDFDCAICLNPPTNAAITPCAHVYCRRCIEKSLARNKEQCPMCRSSLSASDLMCAPKVESAQIGEQSEAPPSSAAMKSSAKVEALIQLLTAVRDKDPTEKSVVFSQFSQMLTCLQGPLTDAGFHFVRLDGSMTVKKRQVALTAFHSKDLTSPTVFLLSLKAAGVGLNLVAASRVFMLDPWWNPAVEEQAMDRVHRLGQTRDVEVVRLVVSDSIEERILELQDRKRQLATFAFEKRSAEQQRLTRIQDVQLLMHL
ncbi:hypothetical protein CY35_11G028300 [Sphagnum magellanicum]|nr:hypothetical protein CY35_11G028300 [Sphagnum magellanicum]